MVLHLSIFAACFAHKHFLLGVGATSTALRGCPTFNLSATAEARRQDNPSGWKIRSYYYTSDC